MSTQQDGGHLQAKRQNPSPCELYLASPLIMNFQPPELSVVHTPQSWYLVTVAWADTETPSLAPVATLSSLIVQPDTDFSTSS